LINIFATFVVELLFFFVYSFIKLNYLEGTKWKQEL